MRGGANAYRRRHIKHLKIYDGVHCTLYRSKRHHQTNDDLLFAKSFWATGFRNSLRDTLWMLNVGRAGVYSIADEWANVREMMTVEWLAKEFFLGS